MGEEAGDLDHRAWMARLGVLVTSIVLFRLGFELWWVGRIHEHLWVQLAVVLLYASGLAFLVLAFLDIDHERLDLVGFYVLLQALASYALVTILVVNRAYSSDALLFVHQSAQHLVNGVDPYTASLAGGYELLDVPYYVQTPTTSGGIVHSLNYPALSFLIYTPFVALGLPDLRPISLGFLLAMLAVLFLATPRHARLLTVSVLFVSSFFLAFSIAGFDIVFVFLLLLAMVHWRSHPNRSAAFYGLSAAVKQTVWFIGPFLLVSRWKETRGQPRRDRKAAVLETLGWGLVAFATPNLPFVLWHPRAWVEGIVTPFGFNGIQLVTLSQGFTIPYYTGALAVDRILLNLLAGSVLLSLLGIYWLRYEELSPIAWVAPPVVLAFAVRSLHNYFDMFFPVALLALVLAYRRSSRSPEDDPTPTGGPIPDPDPEPGSTDEAPLAAEGRA
jgi:uncharacterized membrane protein